MKKIDVILLKILVFSLILFVFSVIFSTEKRNSPKSLESSILNKKYATDIKKIEIEQMGDTEQAEIVTLTSYGKLWTVSDANQAIISRANEKSIHSFIETAVKIRKFYAISSKNTDFSGESNTDNFFMRVSFFVSDADAVSEIYFGHETALTDRIYLSSSVSPHIYETQNDFHQFLTTDVNYWSERAILPEIEQPVKLVFEDFTGSYSAKTVLDEKSEQFLSKIDALRSVRHGILFDGDFLERNENRAGAKRISRLTAFDGNGRIVQIDFFEHTTQSESGEEEKSCFYKKSVLPSQLDTQEIAFAFYSQNAVYELSLWTYGRICSIISP